MGIQRWLKKYFVDKDKNNVQIHENKITPKDEKFILLFFIGYGLFLIIQGLTGLQVSPFIIPLELEKDISFLNIVVGVASVTTFASIFVGGRFHRVPPGVVESAREARWNE